MDPEKLRIGVKYSFDIKVGPNSYSFIIEGSDTPEQAGAKLASDLAEVIKQLEQK